MRDALEAAEVTSAAAQKKVLRVFSDQAIEVRAERHLPASGPPARARAPPRAPRPTGQGRPATKRPRPGRPRRPHAVLRGPEDAATKTTDHQEDHVATKTAAKNHHRLQTAAAARPDPAGRERRDRRAGCPGQGPRPARRSDVVDEIVEAPLAEDVEAEELEGVEAAPETPEVAKTKTPATKGDEDSFTLSTADDDDAPAQQVVTAGATADPVKDYLKQIGKVALLNAEQEVELAKRIEAGLFAEEKLNSGREDRAPSSSASCGGSSRTARTPRTTCSRPTCVSSSRWPSATPAAACSSWT